MHHFLEANAPIITELHAASIVFEILRIVAFAHERRVLLLDIKPENFLFMPASASDARFFKKLDASILDDVPPPESAPSSPLLAVPAVQPSQQPPPRSAKLRKSLARQQSTSLVYDARVVAKSAGFLLQAPNAELWAEEIPFFKLRICDFGLSQVVGEGERFSTIAGSPSYIAPELIYRNYAQEVTPHKELTMKSLAPRTTI